MVSKTCVFSSSLSLRIHVLSVATLRIFARDASDMPQNTFPAKSSGPQCQISATVFLRNPSFTAHISKVDDIVYWMIVWGLKMIINMFKHYFLNNKSICNTSGVIKFVFSGSGQMPLNTLESASRQRQSASRQRQHASRQRQSASQQRKVLAGDVKVDRRL